MMRPELVKLLEDRLAIKSTQYRKKKLKPEELSNFFKKKRGYIENLDQEFIQKLDKLMREYLDEISNN